MAATARTRTGCSTITSIQVILKPNRRRTSGALPAGRSHAIGIDPSVHDIRFVEDDWENPTVGAWGLGWEVWCDGMEVTQFTYFQQVGGIDVRPVSGEITYGLERLAMYVFGLDRVYDLPFNDPQSEYPLTYGDVFLENEKQQSAYNFEHADTEMLFRHFADAEKECCRHDREASCRCRPTSSASRPAMSFNLLDARGVISVNRATELHPARPQPRQGLLRDVAGDAEGSGVLTGMAFSASPPHSNGEVSASYADGGVMPLRCAAHDPSGKTGAPPHLNREESDGRISPRDSVRRDSGAHAGARGG
jgi:hypothetical protein